MNVQRLIKSMRLFLATATFTILVSGAAHGESSLPPPAWPVPDIKPSGTRIQPVTGITLGSFRISLNQTTLEKVLTTLGGAPIGQRGEAGEFLMWICYTVPAANSRIWLTSSELGGRKYIDGVVAQKIELNNKDIPECPKIKATVALIDNRIRIGDTTKKIKKYWAPRTEHPSW